MSLPGSDRAAGLDLPDDLRCRPALLDGNPDDTTASGLHGIAPDNRIRGPIGAFHEYIRLNRANDARGRVLVEHHDTIHAGER